MLHRNLFLVPGRRRSTWQVSTAYRAKAGQSRGRKRRRRQDRRIFEAVVSQVQAEILLEWRDVLGMPVTEDVLDQMTEGAMRAIGRFTPNPVLRLMSVNDRQFVEIRPVMSHSVTNREITPRKVPV